MNGGAAGDYLASLTPSHVSLASTQICPRCQKLLVVCTCGLSLTPNSGSLWGLDTVFITGWDSDDDALLPGDILDIENCESQPGSDLDVASPLCEKNHQHDDFIPVDDFVTNKLPEEIRHPTVSVWLRNCCPLVVRLLRNNTATGRALIISSELGSTIPCDQVHCQYRNTHGRNHVLYGGIGIITNRHVVTNTNEASMTKVEFFYNDDDRRDSVVRELGYHLHLTNRKMDYSMFSCYVHCEDLIKLVENMDMRRQFAWQHIPHHIRQASTAWAIVISHPHGVAKKISFGKVMDREMRCRSVQEKTNFNLVRSLYEICAKTNALERFAAYFAIFPDLPLPYTITWYTTATCRGSSGAPVYMGNTVKENGIEINQAHTHRGLDRVKGYNNCFT
ncbi:hypothetical protein PoB_005797900 [Plakobranchus ocellatus]|uniref:Uncharacterized protein n=1 Tax=Plakobranchus ocellatus TaxID=259542 RepID=A0AAV4CFM0_9GAST|nr:hypothetical protein PoB_005797900 [Plakobranchus ocellatus]